MVTLEKAREAFRQRNWTEAYSLLSSLGKDTPLKPEDGELLAVATFLLGNDEESADTWIRAHNQYLTRGDTEQAIRCAFWAAYVFFNRQEVTRGGAWIARAHHLLETVDAECVEQGYLLLPKALNSINQGDPVAACATLEESLAIADRFGERDLLALARHALGRALIRAGRVNEGSSMLDEAIVMAEAGDISPIIAGEVYCSVISGCMETFDLRRAREWTSTLSHWCESQPDMVAYNGQCLVYRAEILRFHGAWADALEAAEKACHHCLQGPDRAAAGAAYYQRAELHRLRGEFSRAEDDYRLANRAGRKPEPGLALLRLAQHKMDAAKRTMDSAIAQVQERRLRVRLLPACVEIMLAAGDTATAHEAAQELAEIATQNPVPYLNALAVQARGALCVGNGDMRAALPLLRNAWTIWRDLDASYEAARVRVLIGMACRDLGDEETAEMEFDAAGWVFQQLGAGPDQRRVDSLSNANSSGASHGLTPREMEVLKLVAAGKTNKLIASELYISERTVDRHVSNIFMKLNVESRAAATSYAYKHHLI